MTNPEQWQIGATIRDYRLNAALSDESWEGEDARSGKRVVLKRLSRSVPREKPRRDALLTSIRQRGALSHPGIVRILDFFVSDADELVMVTEWVEGETLTARINRGLPTARELAKLSWQLAEAIGHLHERDLFHGNLSPRSILIDLNGNARLSGISVAMLTDRRQRGDATLEKSASGFDLLALAHSSPEQLAGRAIDAQSDIFGLGTLFYELATGKAPFAGITPAEIAEAVTKTNPRNPMELNPRLSQAYLAVIGRSLFKRREQRYASVQPLLDDLRKVEPTVATIAAYPRETRIAAAEQMQTNLFIAEIPYADLLREKDAERATRLESKMQLMLGEAVYLFDGTLIDSVGPRMVASIPSAEKALDAARKAVADLEEFNAAASVDETIEPRMILHHGEVEKSESGVAGEPYSFALSVLESIQPMQLLVSNAVLQSAGVDGGAPLGTIGSVAFHSLPPAPVIEPEPELESVAPLAVDDPLDRATVEPRTVDAASSRSSEPPRRSVVPMLAVAAVALIAIAGLFFFFKRNASDERQIAAAPAPKRPAFAGDRLALQVSVQPGVSEENARLVAAGLRELVSQSGSIKVVDASDSGAMKLKLSVGAPVVPMTASVTSAAPVPAPSGQESVTITPQLSGKPDGAVLSGSDAGVATTEIFKWLASNVNVGDAGRLLSSNPQAMNAFVRAAAAAGDASSDAAIGQVRAALAADPEFLAANRLAYRLLLPRGRKEAMPVAEKLVSLDPNDAATMRQLTSWYVESANPGGAIRTSTSLLGRAADDELALSTLARYSLDAGDTQRFEKAVSRLEKSGAKSPFMHRPDIFAVAGDFDTAAKSYYDIETAQPENAALAFKIGRIAALRESYEIANIELTKLKKLDPTYGAPLLEAYINVKQNKKDGVEALLAKAQQNARWNDDVYTWTAEIYALMSQKERVIGALEKAAERKEATSTLVLIKQPFFYIGYDARSNRLKQRIEANKNEVKAALSGLVF